MSRECEAYSAGFRAAQQGRPIDDRPDYDEAALTLAWNAGWLAEWADYMQLERRCSECGAAHDNWPDDSGGKLCQMYWEAASADLFWQMLAEFPGSWQDPGAALPVEAA